MSRKLITRARIVEAALFSAFQSGMGAVSLADIARSLQIKKASLYNHFSGKEEILSAVYEFSSDFYSRVNFIDEDVFSKVSSESAAELFKNAAENYVRQHELEPLLQIYALVASGKYFNKECLEIFQKQKSKIQKQTLAFFNVTSSLVRNEKLNLQELEFQSNAFTEMFFSLMDSYLAQKKEIIRRNPECDVGSLFALPSDEKGIEKIASLAYEFLRKML